MITADANTLTLNAVVNATLAAIGIIALYNSGGEYFRKAYNTVTQISPTKYQFMFYLTELEGNDTITGLGLCGNGATVTLNSGTTFATQSLSLIKNNTQSLRIIWTIEVI